MLMPEKRQKSFKVQDTYEVSMEATRFDVGVN